MYDRMVIVPGITSLYVYLVHKNTSYNLYFLRINLYLEIVILYALYFNLLLTVPCDTSN